MPGSSDVLIMSGGACRRCSLGGCRETRRLLLRGQYTNLCCVVYLIRGLSNVYVGTPFCAPPDGVARCARCRWRQKELDHKQRDEEESEELRLRQQKALVEKQMRCHQAEPERSVRE